MPEDVAFISSKSGVYTWRDGKVMSAARKIADRQTDRQTAFRLYIVDYYDFRILRIMEMRPT